MNRNAFIFILIANALALTWSIWKLNQISQRADQLQIEQVR